MLQKKYWIAITLAVALVLAAGSVVLAQENPDITIYVKDTTGNGLPNMTVKVWECVDGNYDESDLPAYDDETDLNGKVVCSLDGSGENGKEYEARVFDGEHERGGTRFWVRDESFDVTVWCFSESEVDVNFSVTGPVGVALHVEDGWDRSITFEDTEFPPSRFRVEVTNVPWDSEDTYEVKITALTVDEDWHGNLVWESPDEGQIALKFSDEDTENWGSLDWLTAAGDTIAVDQETDFNGEFWIKGYVGAGTVDMYGRIIFRAELLQQ